MLFAGTIVRGVGAEDDAEAFSSRQKPHPSAALCQFIECGARPSDESLSTLVFANA